jgi:hypothetical protein
MTTPASLIPTLTFKSWLSTGIPNAFGTLTSYSAGTVIPIATYTDWTASVQNANPLTLNARGEANVYALPNVAYKFVEADQFGNQIKTTDQVLNSSIISLYAGVDSGTVNAYQLSFSGPYSALANGIILYWIPSTTNTGNSTLQITVNGTPLGGVVPILNLNGSQLGAGQIAAGGVAVVFYYNGDWLLTSSTVSIQVAGSFTGTLNGGTGGSTNPATCTYSVTGNLASVFLGYMNVLVGPGNTLTMTGLPTILQPATRVQTFPVALASNNGAIITTCLGQVSSGSSVMSFSTGSPPLGGTWTNSASIGAQSFPVTFGQTVVWGLS